MDLAQAVEDRGWSSKLHVSPNQGEFGAFLGQHRPLQRLRNSFYRQRNAAQGHLGQLPSRNSSSRMEGFTQKADHNRGRFRRSSLRVQCVRHSRLVFSSHIVRTGTKVKQRTHGTAHHQTRLERMRRSLQEPFFKHSTNMVAFLNLSLIHI